MNIATRTPLCRRTFSDDWFDDTSDGPVRASIQLDGETDTIDATPAWVIVGPPDFAPGVANLVTLDDIAMQVSVDQGMIAAPSKVSFVRHIQPILARAVGYQWVNTRARQGHAGTRPGNFSKNWAMLSNKLTGPSIASNVINRLRDPRVDPIANPLEPNPQRWMPRLHDETNSAQVLPLTKLQYGFLVEWEAANYEDDLAMPPPGELEPEALTRAALQGCSGGAFFPGIEAGSIMKMPEIYSGPYRINPDTIKPGQITAGNALPWQADFWACRWEDHGGTGGGIGWWPAQRPDQVFPENAPNGPQVAWDRGISGNLGLVKAWHQLGIVVERVINGQKMMVETERTL